MLGSITSRLKNLVLILIILFTSKVSGQSYDTLYQNEIKEFTTDDRFYPESISRIIDHPNIPSPRDHFGTIIGAPGVMHNTEEIFGYYKVLADASPNLIMEHISFSEEGRSIYLITIADQSSIENRDNYKKILSQLADPRTTDSQEAKKLTKEGKPVYYLNAGLHSTEMGSPEMLMELAYRLITDPSEEISNILNNSIILLNPVSEPDGRDRQVDWYYRYSKARSEYNDGFSKSPPYWGKYVFHDNNRDGLQISQELTKAVFNIFFDWHPTVMLDLHESVPLLYISTGTGPYNANIDPITIGEWQSISNHEMTELAVQGLPGVFNWAFYDGWWPGYAIWVANNHNSIGRFYETFGNAGANTYLRDITEYKFAGDSVTSREWYRPTPSTGKVYWSSRNNINYMQAAVLSSLTYVANNGSTLLKNFYQKGVNNTNTGEKGKIKMFVIPDKQRDPVMSAYLVNQLQRQGIEVNQVIEGEYKDEYAIFMDQPYSKLAIDLLTNQKYPKEAKFPPYDDIAWTFGYMYGVEVQTLDSLKYDKSKLKLLNHHVSYAGNVTGEGNDYIVQNKAQSNVLSALYEAKKVNKKMRAYVLDTATVIAEDTVGYGSIILKGLTKNEANNLATKHGLDLTAEIRSLDQTHEINLPRIAVYHSWIDTQAEGWVRFTLEQKKIPFTTIDKSDLKSGKLKSKYDVIIIPHQWGNASLFINGRPDSFGPMPYTKTEQYPSHGTPFASNDITGGPGYDGIGNLSQFINEGGVLIPLKNSSAIMADLGIGKHVSSFNAEKLFHPGSIVTVKKRKSNSPILYGFPEIFHVFKGNGKLLNVPLYKRNLMVLQYGLDSLKDEKKYVGEIMGMSPDNEDNDEVLEGIVESKENVVSDSLVTKNKEKIIEEGENKEPEKLKDPPYVLSGMVRNESEIIGQGAIFNVPLGKGRIIFFTFNPLHRYLNHHDSSLLWNTLMNWNHLDN